MVSWTIWLKLVLQFWKVDSLVLQRKGLVLVNGNSTEIELTLLAIPRMYFTLKSQLFQWFIISPGKKSFNFPSSAAFSSFKFHNACLLTQQYFTINCTRCEKKELFCEKKQQLGEKRGKGLIIVKNSSSKINSQSSRRENSNFGFTFYTFVSGPYITHKLFVRTNQCDILWTFGCIGFGNRWSSYFRLQCARIGCHHGIAYRMWHFVSSGRM